MRHRFNMSWVRIIGAPVCSCPNTLGRCSTELWWVRWKKLNHLQTTFFKQLCFSCKVLSANCSMAPCIVKLTPHSSQWPCKEPRPDDFSSPLAACHHLSKHDAPRSLLWTCACMQYDSRWSLPLAFPTFVWPGTCGVISQIISKLSWCFHN